VLYSLFSSRQLNIQYRSQHLSGCMGVLSIFDTFLPHNDIKLDPINLPTIFHLLAHALSPYTDPDQDPKQLCQPVVG
jgi:hypothetical protein